MAAPSIESVGSGIVNYFKEFRWLNLLGWIAFAVICIAFAYYWFVLRKKSLRVYNKNITAFEVVGINFVPSIRDKARTVKLGTGGFEILQLKKGKTWKLAYGGRVGKDTYYFFVMPDGYWYNGMLSSNLFAIDKEKGLIPVVTTNPLMRSQYTALEKMIEELHKKKTSFWEKYGSWVIGIGFVVISGFMLYLNYKQFKEAMGSLGQFLDGLRQLLDRVAVLSGNVQGGNSGLVPV